MLFVSFVVNTPLHDAQNIKNLVRLIDFPDLFDQLCVGHQTFATLLNFLVTNDAVFIDNKIGTLGQLRLRVEHAVGFDRLQIGKIAHQGKVELEKVGKSLLRKNCVGADTDDFGVHLLKLPIIIPTG